MILCGGILNTFLKAKGYEVGKSLLEEGYVSDAVKILKSDFANKIIFPSDFSCATEDGIANVELSRISTSDTIYDLGSTSINEIKKIVRKKRKGFKFKHPKPL